MKKKVFMLLALMGLTLAAQADETVTMIVRKPGLVAPECGSVHVAPLAYIEPIVSASGGRL